MDYLLNDEESDNDLARKIFIFSNPGLFLLSCPPPCGHFSIQESATGGLSYKAKLQKTLINNQSLRKEATNGFEPMIRELQSHALPLG